MRSRGWDTHAGLWNIGNIGIHINIAAHDLAVLLWQLCIEEDIRARKAAARHAALVMFEISNRAVQLLGGPIRGALTTLGVLDRFDAELRAARRPLDTFRSAHAIDVNEIRNIAAAHRDVDGLRLLTTIENLDIQRIFTATSSIEPPELTQSPT